MPPIKGFIEHSMIDWEGKLASVVFLPGCNFRCAYCHARHLIGPMPIVESIPLEAVLLFLRRQRGWIDGVVISGGEPTLHDKLLDLIMCFRDEEVGVKLDTNGSHPEVVEKLLELGVLDYVAMDVKAPLDQRYSEVTGTEVDVKAIRRSIDLLMSSNVPYEFRTTVCPTQLDEEDIAGIAAAVEGARALFLQPFRPINCLDRSLEEVKPYDPDKMRELCKIAAPHVKRCAVRGDQASQHVSAEAGA